jgi:hypothetical protein
MSWLSETELSGNQGEGAPEFAGRKGVRQRRPLLEHPGHELVWVWFTRVFFGFLNSRNKPWYHRNTRADDGCVCRGRIVI